MARVHARIDGRVRIGSGTVARSFSQPIDFMNTASIERVPVIAHTPRIVYRIESSPGSNAQVFGAVQLITMQLRKLGRVEVRVAEEFLTHPGTLHEQPDVELVGHADAAMHLHAFLDR